MTASYIPLTPSGGWGVSTGQLVFPAGAVISPFLPPYPAGLTGGIMQQVDYVPSPNPSLDPLPAAELQAVATAVLQVPWTAPQLENISVTATRGGETIAFEVDYYVLAPNSVAVPDLSTWAQPSGGGTQQDLWAAAAGQPLSRAAAGAAIQPSRGPATAYRRHAPLHSIRCSPRSTPSSPSIPAQLRSPQPSSPPARLRREPHSCHLARPRPASSSA